MTKAGRHAEIIGTIVNLNNGAWDREHRNRPTWQAQRVD